MTELIIIGKKELSKDKFVEPDENRGATNKPNGDYGQAHILLIKNTYQDGTSGVPMNNLIGYLTTQLFLN